MKLVELCEPAFQYICKINRIGPKGHLDFQLVRPEVKEILTAIEQKAGMDRITADLYQKVKMPLIFFIDSMVVDSGIQCANEWDANRMAYDYNELSGDESFFDDLDRVLAGADPDKSELLAFFYVCLGLGFTGIYFSQPSAILDYISRMEPHLRSFLESDLHQRIVPDAYRFTNTSNLVAAPAPKILGILICFLGVGLAVMITVIYLYFNASNNLAESITEIDQKQVESLNR
ncbi:MAG TPA: DotU family type IV/VI secretion system protein [Oceanipulchritudo sp.]|nr:DotU family type IV/VI secretion system protein [Oceanipulchritudo sp.]